MSWAALVLIAVATTIGVVLRFDALGAVGVAMWWGVIIGGRFMLEWGDRYGWVGEMRARLEASRREGANGA